MLSQSSVFSLCLPTAWASQVALLVKKLPANAGDTGSIPESGRSPGGEGEEQGRQEGGSDTETEGSCFQDKK